MFSKKVYLVEEIDRLCSDGYDPETIANEITHILECYEQYEYILSILLCPKYDSISNEDLVDMIIKNVTC